ncbi:hypothetical protein [Aquabacter sediminis]|uniref:hypothetical protein n=1 Tax=Aquabacter sediminis TaxID=3029197 RepID=UPI00237DA5B8|nr:hypothetical protein [Aquabacter sp. P-9]MDE1567103.1 hypothetical protein [Aquabacter sp. P-9]
MNAPFVAKSATSVKPSSPLFWRAYPGRTALLLPPDGWDPLLWDLSTGDEAKIARRTQILEGLGFERKVLMSRLGHCGHRRLVISIDPLFIHRDILEDGEAFAKSLTIFDRGDYILPGLRHLSAYEFWLKYPEERPSSLADLAGWERRRKLQLDQPSAPDQPPLTPEDQRGARKRAVQRARRQRLATDREWVVANADALKSGARTVPARIPSCRARLPDAQTLADRLATQLEELK